MARGNDSHVNHDWRLNTPDVNAGTYALADPVAFKKPWGTSGYDRDTEGSEGHRWITKNGQKFYRYGQKLHTGDAALSEALNAAGAKILGPDGYTIYDPEYGYLLPESLAHPILKFDAKRAREGESGLTKFFDQYAGMIGMGMMALPAAAAMAGAGTGSTGAAGAAANQAGLAQMAADAGLSGAAADAFVASGGTMGSTAFGGGGVGFGAGQTALPDSYWKMFADAGGNTLTDAATHSNPFPGVVDEFGQLIEGTSGFDTMGATPDGFGSMLETGVPELDQFLKDLGPKVTDAIKLNPLTGQLNFTGGASSGLGSSLMRLLQSGGSSGASALSRLLGGNGSGSDLTSLLGKLGATGLGVFGAKEQTDAFKEMQDKYLALGAPSRARLESSYAPGFSMNNEPGYRDAMDLSSQSVLRKLSATGGNPFDQPNSMTSALDYVTKSTALPQLNTYRSQNAASGQLGVAPAASGGMNAANSSGGTYDALGYGLNSLLNPPSDIQSLLKQLNGGGMKLNLGGGF
jgi:hypothetical protein